MSLIVPDMEMPKSCYCCFMNQGEKRPEYGLSIYCKYSNGVVRDEKYTLGGRLESCKLAEITPDMRPIDANVLVDKVIAKYIEHERNGELVFAAAEIKQDICDMICDAKTIGPEPEVSR